MPANRQKLELTWVGKDERPRLEPRILRPDDARSHHAPFRNPPLPANSPLPVGEGSGVRADHFDNRLIFGDNLLALKALEQEFAGKIKCVYIDPPFNSQQAFEHYDDSVEHSIWLSLMRDRLSIIYKLLSDSGSLFVHIDDNELGYLIVLLDEIFGRNNRTNVITFKQGSATGHKSINPGAVNTSNFILMYAKDKNKWKPNRVFTGRERDKRYGLFIINRDKPVTSWRFTTVSKAFAASLDMTERQAKKLSDYSERVDSFVLENAWAVAQLARPNYDAVSAEARKLIDVSVANPDEIVVLKRIEYSDMYLIGGQRILFYSDKLKQIDGEFVTGEPLTTLWDDLLSNNLHQEGSVDFPKGKKPEGLLKRILELATNPGDWVLDSFAGSGTTGAVAHKMGRRWIMIELGEHCHTHVLPRLQKVIDGTDQGGISKAVNWRGGGGFRYYTLAPSLLAKDKWGNWVINTQYEPAMLAEAVCKLEGFTYAPSDSAFWQHGHSTERDFIYVTTQTLTREQLAFLSEEVGRERTLLACCGAVRAARTDEFDNLTVKKIPQAVLDKCEYGHDDYSLAVAALPPAEPDAGQISLL